MTWILLLWGILALLIVAIAFREELVMLYCRVWMGHLRRRLMKDIEHMGRTKTFDKSRSEGS